MGLDDGAPEALGGEGALGALGGGGGAPGPEATVVEPPPPSPPQPLSVRSTAQTATAHSQPENKNVRMVVTPLVARTLEPTRVIMSGSPAPVEQVR
jgi:hypothetical protein